MTSSLTVKLIIKFKKKRRLEILSLCKVFQDAFVLCTNSVSAIAHSMRPNNYPSLGNLGLYLKSEAYHYNIVNVDIKASLFKNTISNTYAKLKK